MKLVLALCFVGLAHSYEGKPDAEDELDSYTGPYVIPRVFEFFMRDGLLVDASVFSPPDDPYVPNDVDWRTEGLVTSVKDQGQIEGCWAFSATGALEGQIAKKYKKLVSLSEQNLVDCNKKVEDAEYGSWPARAFEYIMKNGINTEESYPYKGQPGVCRLDKNKSVVEVKGWHRIQPTEEALKVAVATVGPISVCVNSTGFQDYEGHVLNTTECSSEPHKADHCALVVGYGTMTNGPHGKEDFWLVKNSWGADWGEEGYIRIARNQNNMCGIVNFATYPIV